MTNVIRAVLEYNSEGSLLYSADDPGAFSRGNTAAAALVKLPEEVNKFRLWSGKELLQLPARVEIVQKHPTGLNVKDADSEVIFDSERNALTQAEYEYLRGLAVRSARDFDRLYRLLPDPDATDIPFRETFYGGGRPRTGREMYVHTNGVTAYYLGEIGLDWENAEHMADNRERALDALERTEGFLTRPAQEGSYGEWWSLRKVMRRFIWHDRIHAKAMYRMARRIWGDVEDVFRIGG